ncbi:MULTISPECIES: DUF1048 domain-containing protein [Nocardia]|uniref:DUF1048 domain-containing protein n=1 Tax=Nocardia TaxID=1817 RepID=UPI001894049D|nr:MULTISPECIES: DUF1048 domain-containing protein [Nocardia]MBF6350262.1 DUF1048 domain-containing protein [Nocardia flavorosea]
MDISNLTAKVAGDLGDKRRWRQYKARARRLPPNQRTAIEGFERYLLHTGRVGGVSIFEDLTDLFERSATESTPIREIVGADPVEFIESFARNYPEDSWIGRERARLIHTIDLAADAGN